MKLYRHYKNKFYKYIGVAKHSETHEELVMYETMYDSAGGRSWVRPKSMFHEIIEVDGISRPRFDLVRPDIAHVTAIGPAHFESIYSIMNHCFAEWNKEALHAKLLANPKHHLCLAKIDGLAVGFKLGYALDVTAFYSWLGGVLPEFRGVGIASSLMHAQHDWCRSQGFSRVETKTMNRYREMLLTNIKHGFSVTGVEMPPSGDLKILLCKSL